MAIRSRVKFATGLVAVLVIGLWQSGPPSGRMWAETVAAAQAQGMSVPSMPDGQTATLLPDGRWLLIGGNGSDSSASLWDPRTGTAAATAGPLQVPRARHTATVLADGTVLVIGGENGRAVVETPEIFDPATGRFTVVPVVGAVARESHTATLLTDGRVLVAGGSNGGATPVATEIWDVTANTATAIGDNAVNRTGHRAILLADGRVLVSGGTSVDGASVTTALVVDPIARTIRPASRLGQEGRVPVVAASLPSNASTDVPVSAHLAVRFSTAMTSSSLNEQTLVLRGPAGIVATRVVPAEGGRLAFVWPVDSLDADTTYTLTIDGAIDRFGRPIVPATITFTTMPRPVDRDAGDDLEEWIPDGGTARNGWRANRPPSPWESLAPLTAPPGVTVTALSMDVVS